MAAEPDDFLLKDYEHKIGYLTEHLGRMWTRFNFFISIESALIGGNFLISSNGPRPQLAAVGMMVSILWYVMGAQDRYLVALYRWQVEKAAKRIANLFPVPADSNPSILNAFTAANAGAREYVGRVDDVIVREFEKDETFRRGSEGWFIQKLDRIGGWRSKSFSITHLAAFYPLIALGLWILLFVFGASLAVYP